MTSREQFAALLSRLKSLIAEGKGDSDEADALRDEMDCPWYAMTEEEREVARKA